MEDQLISNLQERLLRACMEEGPGDGVPHLPLICYALSKEILPAEEYKALENVDLNNGDFLRRHSDHALALAVLWVRRYFEESDGGNYWQQTSPGKKSGNCYRWKNFLKCHAYEIGAGDETSLFPTEGDDFQPWVRSQCWLLRTNGDQGATSLTVKNNRTLYNLLKEDPGCVQKDFDSLDADLQNADYVQWLWEDQHRKEMYLTSLRALTGNGDKAEMPVWCHTVWNCAPDHLGASWKLHRNGNCISVLLYINLPEHTDRTHFTINGRQFSLKKHFIPVEKLRHAGVDVNKAFTLHAGNSSCKVPPLEKTMVFSVKNGEQAKFLLSRFENGDYIPKSRQLLVAHPLHSKLEARIDLKEHKLPLQPIPCRETKESSFSLLSLQSYQQRQLAGGKLVINKVKYDLHFQPGLELVGSVIPGLKRFDIPNDTTKYICGDRVGVSSPDIHLEHSPELIRKVEGGCVILQLADDSLYGKDITLRYAEREGGRGKTCHLRFLPIDWAETAQQVDAKGLPVDGLREGGLEDFIFLEGRTPKIYLRYAGETYLTPLQRPLLYWHRRGTNEDVVGVRHELEDLCFPDAEWTPRILSSERTDEDGMDVVIQVEGDEGETTIPWETFEQNTAVVLAAYVEASHRFRLYYTSLEEGGRHLFFEGRQADTTNRQEALLLAELEFRRGRETPARQAAFVRELLNELDTGTEGCLSVYHSERFRRELFNGASLRWVGVQPEKVVQTQWKLWLMQSRMEAEWHEAEYERGVNRSVLRWKNGYMQPERFLDFLNIILPAYDQSYLVLGMESGACRHMLYWDGASLYPLRELPAGESVIGNDFHGFRLLYEALSPYHPMTGGWVYQDEDDVRINIRRNVPGIQIPVDCGCEEERRIAWFLLLWEQSNAGKSGVKNYVSFIPPKGTPVILKRRNGDYADEAPPPFRLRWEKELKRMRKESTQAIRNYFRPIIAIFPVVGEELEHYLTTKR